MNLRILLLLSLFLNFAACSILSPKKVDHSEKYVTGLGLDPTTPSEEIRFHLRREIGMGGGNIGITIYPYTRPLIDAQVNETAAIRGLSSDAQDNLREQLEKDYLNGKTCFQIDLSVKRSETLSNLKEWKLRAKDGMLHQTNLYWRASDFSRPIMKGEFNDFSGKNSLSLLAGVACSEFALEIRSGVDVTITASSMNFPFPKEETISYKFDQFEFREGQMIKVEEEKTEEAKEESSRKRSRGW